MTREDLLQFLRGLGRPPAKPAAPPLHVLEREHLERTRYDAAWNARFAGRTDEAHVYLNVHRERYFELFNAIAYFTRGREVVDILEVGVSEYIALYKSLFPGLRFATLDRPLTMSGADVEWCRKIGAVDRHYNVDLNSQGLWPEWGDPPLGRFDVVVCTEVIEHLVVNPVEFLEALLSLLEPQGILYLTTPNFFRRENMQKIARRENPQALYPRREGNWDAHHHFREFEMGELLRFVEQAGGRIDAHYFSACWDAPAIREGPLEQRANLVVVARRKEALPTQA